MARLRGEERARYVSRMFGRISRRYDLLNTVMTGGMHYAWRRMAAYTAVGTGLDGVALDVACGTGDFAFDVARKENIEHVVGLDFVPEMLALAKGKAARQGLSGQTTFTVGTRTRCRSRTTASYARRSGSACATSLTCRARWRRWRAW